MKWRKCQRGLRMQQMMQKMGGYIKVYERATGQRFFVAKKNMSTLHKGVACFEAYGVIGETI